MHAISSSSTGDTIGFPAEVTSVARSDKRERKEKEETGENRATERRPLKAANSFAAAAENTADATDDDRRVALSLSYE